MKPVAPLHVAILNNDKYYPYYLTADGTSFFKLERCNFSRNTGVGSMDDFGSAYAVWLVNNLKNRGMLPPTEIIDWYIILYELW